MNDFGVNPLSRIDEFRSSAKLMGWAVGMPQESQALLLLAAVSGALGDRLGFERQGVRHAAGFRLATTGPETGTPPWLEVFWRAVLHLAKPLVIPPDSDCRLPRYRTESRRQLAVLRAVGLDYTFEARFLESSLAVEPFPGGKLTHTLGVPDARQWRGESGPPRGLVALGRKETQAALRDGMPPTALSWMSERDWLRTATPEKVDRLGWLHPLPATSAKPDEEAWKDRAMWFVDRVDALRRNTVLRCMDFAAPAETERKVLTESEWKITDLVEALPACLSDKVEVDTLIGWRIATVLWAFCIERQVFGQENAPHFFALHATVLAEWLAVRHFRLLRMSFPADGQGFFTPTELAVFRQLGSAPATCRDIQRKLRGFSAADCRKALLRAARAGLAVETEGRWSVAPLGAGVGSRRG